MLELIPIYSVIYFSSPIVVKKVDIFGSVSYEKTNKPYAHDVMIVHSGCRHYS